MLIKIAIGAGGFLVGAIGGVVFGAQAGYIGRRKEESEMARAETDMNGDKEMVEMAQKWDKKRAVKASKRAAKASAEAAKANEKAQQAHAAAAA